MVNYNLKRRALHPNACSAGVSSGTPGQCPVTFLRARLQQLPSQRRGGYQPPVRYKPKMMKRVGRIPTAPRRNCRGGSYPPARYKPAVSNQSGRIRTIPQHDAIQPNTQVRQLAGGYEPPLRWLGNCLSLVRRNVTGHPPGVPDDTHARCDIVRGHCPPNYGLSITYARPKTASRLGGSRRNYSSSDFGSSSGVFRK